MSLERFTRKQLVTAQAGDPVADVAGEMLAHHVGAVVVVEGRRPIGIVTDRDLALRVLAERRDLATRVRDVMSTDLATARVDEQLDAAMLRMREHGVRRLPIVDQRGALVGMVTLDDLQVLFGGELAAAAHVVQENRGP